MVLDEWGEFAGHKLSLTHHTQISKLGIQCHPSNYLKGGGHAKYIFFITLLNSTKDVKRVVKKYILDVVFVVKNAF